MLFENKFILDGKPYGWNNGELYRLYHEKGRFVFEDRKLTPASRNNKIGYQIGGAFYTNEEIINLANKKQYEYTARITY